MTVQVYSTLTADTAYNRQINFRPDGSYDIANTVTIKGGTGVANDRVVTPYGVRTELSDADYADIKGDPVFQFHLDGGYLKVEAQVFDAEKVAADMQVGDASSPVTPEEIDFDPEAPQPSAESRGRGRPRKN